MLFTRGKKSKDKDESQAKKPGVNLSDLDALAAEATLRRGLAVRSNGMLTHKTQRNSTDPDSHLQWKVFAERLGHGHCI